MLNTEWQGVIHGIKAKVNDLENWIPTWLRIFGDRARTAIDPLQKRAVQEAFGQDSLPEEKLAFIDHTKQLFERQFIFRFALLDQLSENRQLLIHGGADTGKTWHALELAFRHARASAGHRVLFLSCNKAFTAQLRRLVAALRQIERGEVVVRGWEELFLELCTLAGKSAGTGKIDARPLEFGGWRHIYQHLIRDGRESHAGIFYDVAQRPPFRAADRFDPAVLAAAWSQPAHVRLQPAVRHTRPL